MLRHYALSDIITNNGCKSCSLQSVHGVSSIDIAFCNDAALPFVSNYRIGEPETTADHQCLQLELKLNHCQEEPLQNKTKIRLKDLNVGKLA